MEEDGRGWKRMEEDGRGWKRMEEDGREPTTEESTYIYICIYIYISKVYIYCYGTPSSMRFIVILSIYPL